MYLTDLLLTEELNTTLLPEVRKAAFHYFLQAGEKAYQKIVQIQPLTYKKFVELRSEQRNDFSEELFRKVDSLRDKLYDMVHDHHFWKQDIDALIEGFEALLQRVATAYIEDRYGEIDRTADENYEDRSKRHLFFLQHIVVRIRTDAVNAKTGEAKDAGGHFSRFGGVDWDTAYTRGHVDPRNDLSVGINLDTSVEKLRTLLQQATFRAMHEDLYGEDSSDWHNISHDVLDDMLDTFVHEVTHLEQNIRFELENRQRPLEKQSVKGWGISYLPRPGKGKDRKIGYHPKHRYRYGAKGKSKPWKMGKRGHPSHLEGDDYSGGRWEEYLGTAHEIEAHANSAAAALIAEHFKNSDFPWVSEMERNRQLNEFIDDAIRSLTWGSLMNVHSLRSYRDYIRSRIDRIDQSLGTKPIKPGRYPLPKVDQLHRKVWRIFMKKLVNALLAYKKPVEPDSWDDPPPRTGKLEYPSKKPELP